MNNEIRHIHFIAICGTAMGSLAAMLKTQGYKITGSDLHIYPPMSIFLHEQGIDMFSGFSENNLDPMPDLVIVGNAMSRGNPEVELVLEKKIPYMSLPAALKQFFIQGKHSIVVTGTHGKTTTSSLISWILEVAGKKPNFLIGGIPQNFNQGFKLDESDIFVVEGDEYDSAFFDKAAKFFHYLPDIVVVNNIEFDHADIYDNLEQIKLAFRRLINLIPRNGLLLAGSDDPNVRELIPRALCPVQSFGLGESNFWNARNIIYRPQETIFDVYRENEFFATFSVPLSGDHNVRNALATVGVSRFHGLTISQIQEGLSTFKSVKKRMEIRAVIDDIVIYDDFAHHPTEVRSTIDGLRRSYPNRNIWAIFEPRTSTAKRKIMENAYIDAFDSADISIIAPLHLPQKVNRDELISVEHLIAILNKKNKEAHSFDSVNKIVDYLLCHLKPKDIVLIMSNGEFGGIHNLLIKGLMGRNNG